MRHPGRLRQLGLVIGTCLIASVASAGAQAGPDGPPAAVGPPAGPTCPGPGLTIGTIAIERPPVFDDAVTGVVGRVGRIANGLHVRSREQVIRRELLFAPGGPCQDESLAQSERNLRALGLFQRVEITAAVAEPGIVAVTVTARDAWSLRVDGGYRRVGGVAVWDAQVADVNVAGLGLWLGLRQGQTFERSLVRASVGHQRLFGTREWLTAEIDRQSDGESATVRLVKPFHAIDTTWGHEFAFAGVREHLHLYRDGELSDEYAREAVTATAGLARRLGRAGTDRAWRLSGGFHVRAREHAPLDGSNPAGPDMPPSHRWAGPFVNVHFLQHRYAKYTGLQTPEHDIDLNLGLSLDIGLFVSPAMAAFRTEAGVMPSAGVAHGWLMPGPGVAVARGTVAWRTGGRDETRGAIEGQLRGWWPWSSTHVSALFLEGRALVNPEPGSYLYLGGSPGLRGFREFAFRGTRALLLVAEDRKYFAWKPWKLVQPGVAIFVEAGAIGGDASNPVDAAAKANAGIGFRLAVLRSGKDAPLHVDLAVPLTPGPDGRRTPQLVFGYRSDF